VAERRPEVDPRFDPVFQRGYDPEVHVTPKRPARVGSRSPETFEEVVVAREDQEDGVAPRNPWRLALLLSSIAMVVLGVVLVWWSVQRVSSSSIPDAMELFLQQLGYQVVPALLISGVLGVVLWIALGLLRGRQR
jgi:H+/Cl- antiporter ClcA